MPIRVLLAPWWLRMAYTSAVVILVVFVGVWFARLQGPDIGLPVLGIALIVIGCLVVAALLTAAAGQMRQKYVEALDPVTPAERNQAIHASLKGPIPEDPRVRQAAANVARVSLSLLQRNRVMEIVGYGVMAVVFPANVVIALVDDSPAKAVFWGVLFVILVVGVVQQRSRRRLLQTRAQQLATA